MSINFGRATADNCSPLVRDHGPGPTIAAEPFIRPVLNDVQECVARTGNSGGPAGGVTAITSGRTVWGIAWYINDLLIPLLELKRGTKYTFRVSGGDDASFPLSACKLRSETASNLEDLL